MIDKHRLAALRWDRQCLGDKAGEEEYERLFREVSPVPTVYWTSPGEPPRMPDRTVFDQMFYNQRRRAARDIVKGRFQGGNVGYVDIRDLELYACAYRKPLEELTYQQIKLLELLRDEGPLTIGVMKELTGLLVKQLTPLLHRLQEAFLVYEDQTDDQGDRGWYIFETEFDEVNLGRYTRQQALEEILPRFFFRICFATPEMAHSFYRLPKKALQEAMEGLVGKGVLLPCRWQGQEGYALAQDLSLLETPCPPFLSRPRVLLLNRSDFIVKTQEGELKRRYPAKELCDGKNGILHYILLDGWVRGVVTGRFTFGPSEVERIVVDPEVPTEAMALIEQVVKDFY